MGFRYSNEQHFILEKSGPIADSFFIWPLTNTVPNELFNVRTKWYDTYQFEHTGMREQCALSDQSLERLHAGMACRMRHGHLPYHTVQQRVILCRMDAAMAYCTGTSTSVLGHEEVFLPLSCVRSVDGELVVGARCSSHCRLSNNILRFDDPPKLFFFGS